MSHTDQIDKKKALLKRVKRDLMIFQHAEQHAQTGDAWAAPAFIPTHEPAPTREATSQDAASHNISMVRNRLTGRKTAAAERWNRFAATSSGGGRGR